MEVGKEIYPTPKADRRELPHLARGREERRGAEKRYLGSMPVSAYRRSERHAPWFRAETRDLSNGGILLCNIPESVEIEQGERVFLRFTIPPGMMPEGFENKVKIPATATRVDKPYGEAAFAFERQLDRILARRRWRVFEWGGLFLIFATLALIAFLRMDSFYYFLFDIPVFLYGICASLFLVSRFFFSLFYCDYPVDSEYTPSVSIIVPCFNEEEFITQTIRCALDQDYPEDKLSVIVVDDGSTDKSIDKINEYYEKVLPILQKDRLKIIARKENKGKRSVMAAGTMAADSELLIFVDSDSFLEPDAVRRLVQPMRFPRVGAVCGRCEVENKWTNMVTKMQAVRYFIAFRVFKAAESVFGAVTCLSGPLSCYRRDMVMRHLDDWLNQTFLGYPATYGDDRSLTNYILKHNRVVYQNGAVCSTIVPSSLSKFITQQMRWKRSWFRESLRAAGFMWRSEPFAALSFYAGLLIPILAPMVVIRAFVVIPLMYGYFPYTYIVGIFAMAMLMSATYLVFKRSSLWVYGGFFCLFYLTVLLWQMIPAMFTFWKSEWGTRETAADVKAGKAAAPKAV